MRNKTKIIAVLVLASVMVAKANTIPLGQVSLSGDFTLNHLYDFNHPAAQPFGWFGTQNVQNASGIFSAFIQSGDMLGSQALWTQGNLPLFTIGGFDLASFCVNIAGADSGRFVLGLVDMTGNGFNQDPNTFVAWNFTAPPYDISNFPTDITGAINLTFVASFDNGHVPDTGS